MYGYGEFQAYNAIKSNSTVKSALFYIRYILTLVCKCPVLAISVKFCMQTSTNLNMSPY